MATVREDCTTEDWCSVMRFLWAKDSIQRIFIKKCFLFAVGSVCRMKRFTAGWQTFRWWRRGWDGGAEVAETTVKRLLCCGFRRTGKAMGQVCQCWWRICRKINVSFSRFEYRMFYVLYSFVTLFLKMRKTTGFMYTECESKLLSGFPWPSNGNPESPCI
jgi:hypothetical protein